MSYHRLLDIVHADQKLYLVFEFLDVDLKRYMEAGNSQGTPLSLDLCQVCFVLCFVNCPYPSFSELFSRAYATSTQCRCSPYRRVRVCLCAQLGADRGLLHTPLFNSGYRYPESIDRTGYFVISPATDAHSSRD